MLKKLTIAAAALACAVSPAVAHPKGKAHGYWAKHGQQARSYDRYEEPRYYGERTRDTRMCRDRGTGGTVIGAIAGGLAGNRLVRRDRTAGTIGGAAVGALAGRAIDRDCR